VSRYFDPAQEAVDGQFALPEAAGDGPPEATTMQEMCDWGEGFSEYGQWPVVVPVWSGGEDVCTDGVAPLCLMVPMEAWDSCDWDWYNCQTTRDNWRSRRHWKSWQTEGWTRSRGHRSLHKLSTPHREVSNAHLNTESAGHKEPSSVLIDLSVLCKVPRNRDSTKACRFREARASNKDELASPELIEDQD
jgi:hypothetical protein